MLTEREKQFVKVWGEVALGEGGRLAVSQRMGLSLSNVARVKREVELKTGERLPSLADSMWRARRAK